jgi:co-chaperonin GroES (HSP10)
MAEHEPLKVLEYRDGDDPKQIVFDALGESMEGLELLQNDVLVVTAPTLTMSRGGIIMTHKSKNEQRFQGKTGLVVKLGEIAFKDESRWPNEESRPKVGDWVFFRNSDSSECGINGISCRFIDDTFVKGRVSTPDAIR